MIETSGPCFDSISTPEDDVPGFQERREAETDRLALLTELVQSLVESAGALLEAMGEGDDGFSTLREELQISIDRVDVEGV